MPLVSSTYASQGLHQRYEPAASSYALGTVPATAWASMPVRGHRLGERATKSCPLETA
uniref:Uncharacterized protein n=1 Tax=Oryza sativa subsp. japonica TaxID=39947 RepID=Q69J39_ORYSJ|nr:hypothetical protein [Oryza sativa Japonica Group]BAD32023.1 hypothetical protein [Oryza sativa Japonica Group]